MRKREIKERLDDLGIDYTGITSKDELMELLPTDNPTDYDPLATVKLVDKGQGQDLNIVAPTLKAFMKMVKAKFNWSKVIAVATHNSLDENSDINYTLELGDKSTYKKVVQPDGSEIKEFTGQVLRVISSSTVNDLLNNGQLTEDDLFGLQVSMIELMDKRTGNFEPRFFLVAPRKSGFAGRKERDEDIAVREDYVIRRKMKAIYQLR